MNSSSMCAVTGVCIPWKCVRVLTQAPRFIVRELEANPVRPFVVDGRVFRHYFGIDYDDQNLDPGSAYKFCGPAGTLEVPDADWPYTGRGNSVAFGSAVSGDLLFPFYVFRIDGGAEGSYFSTAANPTSGYASFVDDGDPPEMDEVTRFGTIRWFAAGSNECPVAPPPDEGGDNGIDTPGDGGTDGGAGDTSEEPGDPPSSATNEVVVFTERGVILSGQDLENPTPLASVEFSGTTLPAILDTLQVATVQAEYSTFEAADTLSTNANGETVSLIDLSRFYALRFPSTEAAWQALPDLAQSPGIVFAEPVLNEDLRVTTNDAHFDSITAVTFIDHDAQWHLRNDGGRRRDDQGAVCDTARVGYDISVEPVWNAIPGYGSHDVVIGIADTGILSGDVDPDSLHPDLRVHRVSDYTLRRLIQEHPTMDWCTVHGTRMAGLAAAKTNNAIGVAGVCGDCTLLDIEISDSLCGCEDHKKECDAVDTRSYARRIYNATLPGILSAGQHLMAVNMSFEGPGFISGTKMAALWNTMKKGVTLIAGSGDRPNREGTPQYIHPANVPFVFGIGGATWEGRIWDWPASSCYADTNGTTWGFNESPGELGSLVKICAPASGTMASTEPVQHAGADGYYWTTSGQCSAAAAIVSGTVGLLQSSMPLAQLSYLDPEDVMGILKASADPFRIDPLNEPNRSCTECPREMFGSGMLNADQAHKLARNYRNRWDDPRWIRVVSKAHHDFAWEFTFVSEWTVPGEGTYRQYKASAAVIVPASDLGNGLPSRIAWVRQSDPTTTSFPGYGEFLAGQPKYVRTDVAYSGIHGCYLGEINQETGLAYIHGYAFAKVVNGQNQWIGGINEDNIAMTYRIVGFAPSNVAESGGLDSGPLCSIKTVKCLPGGAWELSWVLSKNSAVSWAIYDVGGRSLREERLGVVLRGQHVLAWDGLDGSGRSTPSGVYWIRIATEDGRAAKKLVVLR